MNTFRLSWSDVHFTNIFSHKPFSKTHQTLWTRSTTHTNNLQILVTTTTSTTDNFIVMNVCWVRGAHSVLCWGRICSVCVCDVLVSPYRNLANTRIHMHKHTLALFKTKIAGGEPRLALLCRPRTMAWMNELRVCATTVAESICCHLVWPKPSSESSHDFFVNEFIYGVIHMRVCVCVCREHPTGNGNG